MVCKPLPWHYASIDWLGKEHMIETDIQGSVKAKGGMTDCQSIKEGREAQQKKKT